ncbi:MAG: helix-turn-helix transcriptional regulator [Proteobacteria bacterium]|nr:helix-turn-helix transcriptional regulator [Pseudomonadota bacterium]
MDINQAALCLEKLGNPTRLAIVRLLVRAGDDGLPVGDIRRHMGVPASTLSHHILHLVSGGLIRQVRQGRVLRCKLDYALMQALVDMLTEECCAGVDTAAPDRQAS